MTGEARARAERRVAVFPLGRPSPTTEETAVGSRGCGGGEGGGEGGCGRGEAGSTPCSPEDSHYRHAAALLTLQGVTNLQGVEYIVNPKVEAAYVKKTGEMRARLGSACVNERLLFHGTFFANSERIVHENFSLDKVGGGRGCILNY
jgi:hypothetical protein